MRSIRDVFRRMPETRTELADYVMKHYSGIRELVEKDPAYRSRLQELAGETVDRYGKYMGGLADKLSGAGHVVGYTADAWLLHTGDIVGSLGGKFLNFLAQIPEKAYSVSYGIRTGNYLDSLQNIFEGVVSYLPGLTFVDQGLTRIIQKRMVSDLATRLEKEAGIYKPWTTKLAERLSNVYTGVKDRLANVFKPSYEPQLEFA